MGLRIEVSFVVRLIWKRLANIVQVVKRSFSESFDDIYDESFFIICRSEVFIRSVQLVELFFLEYHFRSKMT